jgi:8-oxo-dGTP diphosphatase
MEKLNREPIAVGTWGDHYTWELHASNEVPPAELVTAVACVALADNTGSIVLTRNQRGWEILAGHMEPGEDILEALRREAEEEGGYIISDATCFGYRKVTALQRPTSGTREFKYPFPTSYIVYFLTRTTSPIGTPTGEEILESRVFTPAEQQALADAGELSQTELTIIKLGLKGLVANSSQ